MKQTSFSFLQIFIYRKNNNLPIVQKKKFINDNLEPNLLFERMKTDFKRILNEKEIKASSFFSYDAREYKNQQAMYMSNAKQKKCDAYVLMWAKNMNWILIILGINNNGIMMIFKNITCCCWWKTSNIIFLHARIYKSWIISNIFQFFCWA